eukprot:6205748-Pleurochrysis_carterae.AAC.2
MRSGDCAMSAPDIAQPFRVFRPARHSPVGTPLAVSAPNKQDPLQLAVIVVSPQDSESRQRVLRPAAGTIWEGGGS